MSGLQTDTNARAAQQLFDELKTARRQSTMADAVALEARAQVQALELASDLANGDFDAAHAKFREMIGGRP